MRKVISLKLKSISVFKGGKINLNIMQENILFKILFLTLTLMENKQNICNIYTSKSSRD